jgi:hypothetical protein
MEKICGKRAYQSLEHNPAAYWCERPQASVLGRKSAAAKLAQNFPALTLPVIPVRSTPDRLPRLYAVGSCFAREIERSLAQSWRVLSSIDSQFGACDSHGLARCNWVDFANRYNPASLLREVERLTGDRPLEDRDLIVGDTNAAIDLHFIAAGLASRAQLLSRRHLTLQAGEGLARADVVIVTVGLNEAWFDTDTGAYLNNAPPAILAASGRFEVHILSCDDVVDHLSRTTKLIRAVNNSATIVISVSPVPMLATFTDDDVICANSRSKATLLAATREVCSNSSSVYFPSFELVTHANSTLAWNEDRRHPSIAMIDQVVKAFVEATLPV